MLRSKWKAADVVVNCVGKAEWEAGVELSDLPIMQQKKNRRTIYMSTHSRTNARTHSRTHMDHQTQEQKIHMQTHTLTIIDT
jgi:hypothetical protein